MPAASTPLSVAAAWVDPEAVFAALAGAHDDLFWLDSGADAVGGRSYLGASTRTLLGEALPAEVGDLELGGSEEGPTGRGMQSGWVGWVGYEAGVRLLTGGLAPTGSPAGTAPEEGPDAAPPQVALLRAERVLVVDHAARSLELRTASDTTADRDWIDTTLSMLDGLADTVGPPSRPVSESPARQARWRHGDAAYLERIERCHAAIARGDAYQLCLTNTATVDGVGLDEAVDLYLRMRRGSPAHHGGFVRAGGFALLSASPEQFVRVDGEGVLTTRPIKGTRPRGVDPLDDAAAAAELAADPKERAENVMIVDLLRNDVSRVSLPDSVEVPGLLEVESYRHVHQLVSTVRAKLRPGTTVGGLLAAVLPPGSMTGAPKRSAVDLLGELEAGPRGIYSGAFGWIDDGGTADLAVVIRSIVVGGGRATVGAGGGITADSVPERELAEVALKARPLVAALGVRVDAADLSGG